MKYTKVLILEDRAMEASYLRDALVELGYQVPAIAPSLSKGLEYFSLYQPDISLVDIYLDGKPDGIAFGMEMNGKQNTKKPFVFLTGATETSTFKLAKAAKPYHYLVKPFNKPELQYAIELALERFETETPLPVNSNKACFSTDSVFVKRGNSLINVQYDDINYIEVEGKYSKIVCNNQKFVVQQSLGDLYISLPATQFFRVHRSYVINIKEVTRIDTQTHEIFFKNGNTLFFSRRNLEEFLHMSKLIK